MKIEKQTKREINKLQDSETERESHLDTNTPQAQRTQDPERWPEASASPK